ncbi:MAG TPA: riboflavin synthase [Sumerlaeia bacterium]|nr:riboflavin synthase [Sumerlaeia bacterium]
MFTGLIEEIGRLSSVEAHGRTARLTVAASSALVGELSVGDSVAVDGVCLTVERAGGGEFAAHREFTAFASEETLARTTLGQAEGGRAVNLERALRVGDRLGGHFVAGHVDATGELLALDPRDGGWLLRVAAPEEILSVSVPKGSIAVDGISLTLVDVSATDFTVAIIPRTYTGTTLHLREPGDKLNLESDVIAKHVARTAGVYRGSDREAPGPGSVFEVLQQNGFMSDPRADAVLGTESGPSHT